MQENDIEVKQSCEAADYDIATSACSHVEKEHVVGLSEDADVFTLLPFLFNERDHDRIYFQTSSRLVDICILKSSLDQY